MTLRETIETLLAAGYVLKRNERGKIEFPIPNEDAFTEDLDVPKRMKNAILRNKFMTMGQLVDFFNSGETLGNVGAKTIGDTKRAIIEWVWDSLNEKGKAKYLQTIFM